jgi:hypothetical protein
MMTLTLATVPPLVFDVLEAGAQRAALNGEVPSVTVTIDNARGDAAARLALPPLRARATLADAGEVLFVGTVQSVTLDAVASLSLEA